MKRRVAILGNLCVGKTSLFDQLCRRGEHAVNIPGSTQSVTQGALGAGPWASAARSRRACAGCHEGCALETEIELYDTPGSATLAAHGEDEMVTRDLLLSGQVDALLLVADATNLRRSLALALEVAELELPMVPRRSRQPNDRSRGSRGAPSR